ncbi:hypothetical protein NO1_1861 [Candidatus Termititenax aidoneus]|uniref:Peptidase M23 domain-containing protein n=1 Tax=Termititenax aidoneus TaxID=2218524 RepID=A0A388TDZ2_TERA1|nr:hypothetical protein NO1_1861 [Candidatus Termititenax aidoneus]
MGASNSGILTSIFNEQNQKMAEELARRHFPNETVPSANVKALPSITELASPNNSIFLGDNWLDDWQERQKAQALTLLRAAFQNHTKGGYYRIRDDWGEGHYGATRNNIDGSYRSHAGIDYITLENNGLGEVFSPFKIGGYLYADRKYPDGVKIDVAINGKRYLARILHITPNVKLLNSFITGDTVIGSIRDITRDADYQNIWRRPITNHAHTELYELLPDGRTVTLNPAEYIPTQKPVPYLNIWGW